MKNIVVYPYIFDFQSTVPQKINKSKIDFYNFFLSSIFVNHNFKWSNHLHYDRNSILSIPVSETISAKNTNFLKDYISKNIKNNSMLFDKNAFISSFVIFIDIYTLDRQPMLFHLSIELNELLLNNSMKPRIIFFTSSLTKEFAELSFFPINSFIEDNSVIIIDENGNVSDKNIDKKIDKVTFRQQFSKTHPDLSSLLETKFIRRLGHFNREKYTNNFLCQRTYYDGRFCKEEIVGLFLLHIKRYEKRKKILSIFYSAEESPWLKQSIYVLDSYLGPKYGTNNLLKLKDVPFNKLSKDDGYILILTDLINRGTTLVTNFAELRKRLPKRKMQDFLFFSVLNNVKLATNSRNKIRTTSFQSYKLKITYFLDVHFHEIHSDNCVQCKLGIEHDSYSGDTDNSIRPYDFWELSIKSKFKKEDFIPNHRKGLQIMPNYIELLNKEYASYYAYKFNNMLNKNNFNTEQITIVIPDETKNKKSKVKNIEQTPSGRFALALNELFGIDFVAIPRNILENVNKYIIETELIEKDIWFSQLREIDSDIIIVDEVNVSGGTFKSIFTMLASLNKKTICYFALLDLNPQKTKDNMTKYPDIQFYNIYEFQH